MSLDVTLICRMDSGNSDYQFIDVFDANITHNLTKMAEQAGIYKCCWRPEEIGAKKARDIADLLEAGLKSLKGDPEYFKKFDSFNGWGTYNDFVPWVESYLEACKKYPNATIRVSR